MTVPITVALLGTGNSGRFYHLPHLLDAERYDLRVVVGEHAGSASAHAHTSRAELSTDWMRAVSRTDVELVVVALPHAMHYPVALEALHRGKHVLVEKPMTVTLAEADELIAAAKEAGVVLMVHHQRRWEADFVAMSDVVHSGEIGDVWRMVVARGHQGPYKSASPASPHNGHEVLRWAHRRALGGGIGRVVGPHPVDHLLALAGSPASTVSARTPVGEGEDVEDWIGLDVGFDSGATGRVDVFRFSGIAAPRFVVHGTKGMAVAGTSTDVEVRLKEGGGRQINGLQPPGILGAEIYRDLYRAIRFGERPRVTAQDARAVVAVLDAAFRSAELGGVAVGVDSS
jgi:predicted dehydrogenase